jgi:uncharacterized membrane protein YfcA
MWELLLLPLLGLLIGTAAAMTGIGGGAFIVPLLTLFYAFTPPNAVGTSLTTIIFTAIASTMSYSRQKRIYYRTGLILATATVPGAFLGAYLTSVIPPRTLGLFFGVFLGIVALRMIITVNAHLKNSKNGKGKPDPLGYSEKELLERKKKLLSGVALSFFGGVASGLLGIGGGVLLVPIMTLAMGMAIHTAVATSMFTMILTSISGVAQHYMLGNIRFEYVLPIALGTIIGAQLGAYTSRRLSSKNLHRIFGLILIVVGIQMILKYI